MTKQFHHRSLKIRHKNLSVTILLTVIYWASQIKSADVFFEIITDEDNLWRFLTVMKPFWARAVQPRPTIRDEIKRHRWLRRGAQYDRWRGRWHMCNNVAADVDDDVAPDVTYDGPLIF
jgi:hypothetical protein